MSVLSILHRNENDSLDNWYLEDMSSDRFDDFVAFILKLVSSRPALISQQTSELRVNMDETKVYRYPLDSKNFKKLEIIVENLKDSTEVSGFFDVSTTIENARVNSFRMPSYLQYGKSSATNLTIDVLENSTYLLLNVAGIEDTNVFKLKINPIKSTNSLANMPRTMSIFHYFVSISLIYFFT